MGEQQAGKQEEPDKNRTRPGQIKFTRSVPLAAGCNPSRRTNCEANVSLLQTAQTSKDIFTF